MESGNAVAMIPWMKMPIASNPGRIRVPKLAPAVLWKPCPIFGNRYVKTNTNSSGFMMVRMRKATNCRRRTAKSRRKNPKKARHFNPESVTQFSPRQLDEDRLKAGLADLHVIQRVAGDAHDSGQQAAAAIGEQAQAIR